jgi:hypothetical protein
VKKAKPVRRRLTERLIDSLRPNGERQLIWDSRTVGLGLADGKALLYITQQSGIGGVIGKID